MSAHPTASLGHRSGDVARQTAIPDRHDVGPAGAEVGDGWTAPARPRDSPRLLPHVAEPDPERIEEAAPLSVSAGQDRFSDVYPRPDSNRRYRLERAAC